MCVFHGCDVSSNISPCVQSCVNHTNSPEFTVYNLPKEYLPSVHNLTTKYHKHQETATTHTNHTHHISHYPLHPSHPNFLQNKQILQDSAFDQARVVKVRYTRSAHDSHPPTNGGNRPPNDRTRFGCCRPTTFGLSASAGRLAAFTWGNA